MSAVPTKECSVCGCRFSIGLGSCHSEARECVDALRLKLKNLAALKTREMIDGVLGCAKHEDDLREEKARVAFLEGLIREAPHSGNCATRCANPQLRSKRHAGRGSACDCFKSRAEVKG